MSEKIYSYIKDLIIYKIKKVKDHIGSIELVATPANLFPGMYDEDRQEVDMNKIKQLVINQGMTVREFDTEEEFYDASTNFIEEAEEKVNSILRSYKN